MNNCAKSGDDGECEMLVFGMLGVNSMGMPGDEEWSGWMSLEA